MPTERDDQHSNRDSKVTPQPVAEAGEKMRDPVHLNGGEIVSYLKQVSAGEPGWDPNQKMALIQHADMTTSVVPLTDISKPGGAPPIVQASMPDRVGDQEQIPAQLEREKIVRDKQP